MEPARQQESGSPAQTLIGLSLVAVGFIAVTIMAYGLTSASANWMAMAVGGLAAYLVVWLLALWLASSS